jgi:hypothetical protein
VVVGGIVIGGTGHTVSGCTAQNVVAGGIVHSGTGHTVSGCTAQNVVAGGIVNGGTGHTFVRCTARAFANHIVYQDNGKTVLRDLTADNYVRPNLWFGSNYPADPKQFYVDVFGIGGFSFARERVWGYGYVKNWWDAAPADPTTWEFQLTRMMNRGPLWIDFPVGMTDDEIRIRATASIPAGDSLKIQIFPRGNDPFVHAPTQEWIFTAGQSIDVAFMPPQLTEWTVRVIANMNQMATPITLQSLSIRATRIEIPVVREHLQARIGDRAVPELSPIVRGNDVEYIVDITDSARRPLDITGATVVCHVRNKPGGILLFAGTAQVLDPPRGRVRIAFRSADTANLPSGQRVHFDLLLTFPDGRRVNVPSPPWWAVVVDRVTE